MRWYFEGVLKDLDGLRIFALRLKKVAVKIPGIQSMGRQIDGLFEQLPCVRLVAESDRKAGDAIVQHAKAGRGAGIHPRGVQIVGLFEDVAGALGKTECRKRACHRGALARDDAIPNQSLGHSWRARRDSVSLFTKRVNWIGL